MLPCLEDLAIDERLPDFSFFDGLGQCVFDSCTDDHYQGPPELEATEEKWLWSMVQLQHESRPFLKSLRISFDPAVQVKTWPTSDHK